MNKKIGVLGLIVALASPLAFAGSGHDGKHGKHDRQEMQARALEKLTTDLNLSAAQEVQVKAVFQETGDQMKVLHEEMRAKKTAVRDASHKKIESVLTTEQKVKYAAHLAERKERAKERHEGR